MFLFFFESPLLSALGFVFLRNESKFGTDIFIKQLLVVLRVRLQSYFQWLFCFIKGLGFRSMKAKTLR